jgi:superfamily I DNA/RNA helicase
MFNALLQLLDDGMLTDSQGRTVDLSMASSPAAPGTGGAGSTTNPHPLNLAQDRRSFYVGLTRAVDAVLLITGTY